MSREEDVGAREPLTDPASPLAGTRPDGAELKPPVSPFTTAAHRIANEAQTDERALRQMEAEREHRAAQEGAAKT